MEVEEEHVSSELTEEIKEKKIHKPHTTVLDNFTKLTNVQEKIRIRSGNNLVKYFIENKTKENGSEEVKYALARLVRGLGSSRLTARSGFYTTLTALLTIHHDLDVETLFNHIGKHLKKAGSNSKSENADICAGQILAGAAIIRSDLYSRSNESDKKRVLKLILDAGKERDYLRLAAYEVLIDLVKKVDDDEFEEILFPFIKEEVSKPWEEQNLDSLYLLLSVQSLGKSIKPKFILRFLGTVDVICIENLKHLVNILMGDISRLESLKHPVRDLISKKIASLELITPFMNEVNRHLEKPNRNRFLNATKIIITLLHSLESQQQLIPDMLVDNYIIQLLSSMKPTVGKKSDPEFLQSVRNMFDSLVEALKDENVKHKTSISVIKRFIFYPGVLHFERATKSKIIQNLTQTLSTKGVKRLASVYREIILAEIHKFDENGAKVNWFNTERLYAADLLIKLLNHTAVVEEIEWKTEQLKLLMNLGLLKSQINIGSELADALKERFFRALDLKLKKLEDLRSVLSSLVHELDSIVNENNLETILRNPVCTEDYQVWQKAVKTISKMENSKNKQDSINSVFHTLFLHMALQIFNSPRLARDSLNELFVCYERTGKSRKSLKAVTEESDDPNWIEVVVDLFLNLLSHNSHLLRHIMNCVFPHLSKHLNVNAVYQILSVLDPKNESNPLSKPGEESDSESEGSDNENEEKDDDEEKSSSDSDNNQDEDINEDETVNDKLRMALHEVLSKSNKGGDGDDDDDESVDLDDMSESEGGKLDEALAKAFKQFKPNLGKNNKKQNKDDLTLMHFRVRVLDLIHIYLDSNLSMLLTLEIMLPLLQLFEFSIRDVHQKPLQDRVRSCIKKLTSIKKFDSFEDVNETVLADLLNSLLDKGTKNALLIQEMGDEISHCCIFVIKCSQMLTSTEKTPKKEKKRVRNILTSILENTLETYFKKRDCLTPHVLFKDLFRLSWDGTVTLVPRIIDFAFDEQIRPFRKNQALELLGIFLSNNRYLKEHSDHIRNKLSQSFETLYQNIVDLFVKLCENPADSNVKEKYICNLFISLNMLHSSPLKVEYEWGRIGEVVREYRSNVSFSNDTKTAYSKLCNSLGISKVVKMKQQPVKLQSESKTDGSVDENSGRNKKNKQKKRKNKEMMKLKKESKEKRLQGLSEGFYTNVTFSNGNINDDEMDDTAKNYDISMSEETSEGNAGASVTNHSEETHHKKGKKRKGKREISLENPKKQKHLTNGH